MDCRKPVPSGHRQRQARETSGENVLIDNVQPEPVSVAQPGIMLFGAHDVTGDDGQGGNAAHLVRVGEPLRPPYPLRRMVLAEIDPAGGELTGRQANRGEPGQSTAIAAYHFTG